MGCSLWSVMCFLLFLLLAEAIILSGLLHKSHCFHPNALIYRSISFRAFSHLQCLVHLCFVFCGKGLYGLASSCEINFSIFSNSPEHNTSFLHLLLLLLPQTHQANKQTDYSPSSDAFCFAWSALGFFLCVKTNQITVKSYKLINEF